MAKDGSWYDKVINHEESGDYSLKNCLSKIKQLILEQIVVK